MDKNMKAMLKATKPPSVAKVEELLRDNGFAIDFVDSMARLKESNKGLIAMDLINSCIANDPLKLSLGAILCFEAGRERGREEERNAISN
jgi:hypothetical protein